MEKEEKQGFLHASMEEIVPLMLESLREGRSVEFSPRGKSMLPVLREGRDSVVLSLPSGRLKKYDIPLYRRSDGSYILHRVVKVGENYTCVGDNQYKLEDGVKDENVIAVVTKIRRGKKLFGTKNVFYRIYTVFWCSTRPVRHFCLRVKRKIGRIINKK